MEKLEDINIHNLDIKLGDIKVDAAELQRLFDLLGVYHNILYYELQDQLKPEQKEDLQHGLAYTEYLQNKYLVLGHLRENQRQMFDFMKDLEKFAQKKDNEDELKEIEKLKRDAWGMYVETKNEREKLQKEVDEKKRIFFDSATNQFLYQFH